MNLNFKKLVAAFAAVAAPFMGLAGMAAASAAPAAAPTSLTVAPKTAFTNDVQGGWQKTECYYWNPVESWGQTCYTESYPGARPPYWDTTAFTPYFNGRDVIYGPGAVQWNR
jgi:hypothetical protein